MVGRPLVQHFRCRTHDAARDAAVQPQRHDLAGAVRTLARADIGEAVETHRPHRVEISDDGGRPFHLLHDVAQLIAVEELTMAQVHIGDGDAVEVDNLGQPRRHPAGQDGCRQADGG